MPEELHYRQGRLKACKPRLEEEAARALQQARIDERKDPQEQATGKKRREQKQKTPDELADPAAVANVTDPDSRIL